jgi:hypothetical protein
MDSPEYKLIRVLVRKILSVGTHNLSILVDDWKEWGTYLFHTVSKTQTIGPLVVPKYNNIFKRLDGLICVSKLMTGERSQLLLQQLAHLISSRQMPYMGLQTEIKALTKFREVLETDFRPSPEVLSDLGKAARRIGGICCRIRKFPSPHHVAHVSVTSSGERDYPCSKGAQAAAVRDALVRILTRVPEQDLEEKTPFGIAYHVKGKPLWRTLFRDKDDPMYNSTLEYLEQIKRGFPVESGLHFAGLDRVTGRHVMYVAWKELEPLPIVLRAQVVPEMGNKARIVTLSPYWVNVLQAPLAHLLVDGLRMHPSAFSSFARQDQAWDACRQMIRLKDISLEDDHAVLSSDLSDATNTQHFELTKVMLREFLHGYLRIDKLSEYVELVLGTIGPRAVLLDEMTTVISTTGIMMGEAIAKPSLTLLNLAIEEAAFLTYNNRRDVLDGEHASPNKGWRFFHVGGDDHLAKGPLPYLNLITDYHLRAGSHIKPGQHGCSRICVRYCERLINLDNLQHRLLYVGGNIHLDRYRDSIIIDSIKVRLLERGQSTLILKDNKNVAIGKSAQLVKVLEWLPIDNIHYTYDKIVSIRNLFINRMGPLLPSKVLHPRAYAAIHLPTIVGGYGLGFVDELSRAWEQSPEPHKWLLSKILSGADVTDELRLFSRLNRNISQRGVELSALLREKVQDFIEKYPDVVELKSFAEIKQEFYHESLSNREILFQAKGKGYFSVREFVEWSVRGNLFQELLLGNRKLNIFNTVPYTRTYQKVWDECEDLGLNHYGITKDVTKEHIAKAMESLGPQWFLNINLEIPVFIGNPEDDSLEDDDLVNIPLKEAFTRGLPDLQVGKAFIGCDRF